MMKIMNIKYFISAAMVMLLCSCVEEKLEVGEYDYENCTGVYFPEEQENIDSHIFEVDVDPTFLEFKVRRTDADEAISVPYEYKVYRVVKTQEAGDTAYVEVPVEDINKFKFDKTINFAKYQKETTVKVSFDGITTGETFHCSLSITDPAYVSSYSDVTTSISFDIMMCEWEKVKGNAIFRDGLLSDILLGKGLFLENDKVEVYQRKDKKGYYRFKGMYSASYLARLILGDEEYNTNPEVITKEYERYSDADAFIYMDATDSSKVYFPAQKTGFSDPGLGDVYIASDVPEVFTSSSNMLYGTLSKDGVITFPKYALTFGIEGIFYFGNSEEKFRIILPGGNVEDFDIDLKAGDRKSDGYTPVTFSVADDVKRIKYSVFQGKINNIALADSIAKVEQNGIVVDITDGEFKITKDIKPLKEDAPTDIYTLVACTYGEEGTGYKEFATVEFGYIKPGDTRKVEIFFGLTADDLYASDNPSLNYSSENSFQYWVRGKNITHAQISYYHTDYYRTYEKLIKESMIKGSSISNDMLKQINDYGISGILGNKLEPATSYTFIIYAGNEYNKEFFIGEVSTKGQPDFVQKTYYYSNLEDYYSSDEYLTGDQTQYSFEGSWIPVSVDIFSETATGRTIRGNWRAEEVTLTTEGDVVTAEGLFPALSTNPKIKFDLREDGKIYTVENIGARVMVKDSTNIIPNLRFEYLYIPKLGSLSYDGYFYDKYDTEDEEDRRDMFVGGFVHKDIIAFVDNKTQHRFWAMILGGYQKDGRGQEYQSNLIGDGHGDLILIRKGSELLGKLEKKTSQAKKAGQTLSSITEAHRVVLPEINSLKTNTDKFDNIAHGDVVYRSEMKVKGYMNF